MPDPLGRLREALSGYVGSEAIEAAVSTLGRLSETQRTGAVEMALPLAGCSPKATIEYIRCLPDVALLMTAEELAAWAGLGLRVAERSPNAAVKYFRQGPELLRRLGAGSRLAILELGARLAAQDYGVALEFIRQAPDATPDRKSTRLNSSHIQKSRMPSSA